MTETMLFACVYTLVAYKNASPEVKEIYNEIKNVPGLPFILNSDRGFNITEQLPELPTYYINSTAIKMVTKTALKPAPVTGNNAEDLMDDGFSVDEITERWCRQVL